MADEALIKDCEDYINGLILNGLNSYNDFFQSYCSYATAMGITFVRDTFNIMYVAIRGKETSFNIDAVQAVSKLDTDGDILFCVAHEVKHLLYRHLLKYGDMFSDDVVQVFLNMCTDVEINESLRDELTRYERNVFSHIRVPQNILYIHTVAEILDMDRDGLEDVYRVKKFSGAFSDYLYTLFDKRCKEWLGYDISEILYRVKLNGFTSFSDEIFKVVDGEKSAIFNITNPGKARKYCEAIAKYLTRNLTAFIISGGNDKSLAGGNASGPVKDYKSARDEFIIDGSVNPFEVDDILGDVEEIKDNFVKELSRRGRSPGGSGVFEKVEAFDCETTVPWQAILRNRLMTLSSKKVYTKKRINRRQPDRLELSGKKTKKEVNLVIAIDESGSIGNLEYVYFLHEISNIVSQVDCNVHLYEFTSSIESYTYLDNTKAKKELRKGGRLFSSRFNGGTCFQPVFDAIHKNSKIRNNESILIIFTDGAGESDVEFYGMKNRLWVVVGEKSELSVEGELASNIFPVVAVKRKNKRKV